MTPSAVLYNVLSDLDLLTDEEAERAIPHITENRPYGVAAVGVEIDGRHYIISVEDVSS